MTKYFCLCGDEFINKQIADLHIKIRENDNDAWAHQVVKRNWKARLLDWILCINYARLFRLIGFFMAYFVTINHFNINWSFCEAVLIGIGMGLYIE